MLKSVEMVGCPRLTDAGLVVGLHGKPALFDVSPHQQAIFSDQGILYALTGRLLYTAYDSPMGMVKARPPQ